MTEVFKKDYMTKLFTDIIDESKPEMWRSVMCDSYDAKVALGWPDVSQDFNLL